MSKPAGTGLGSLNITNQQNIIVGNASGSDLTNAGANGDHTLNKRGSGDLLANSMSQRGGILNNNDSMKENVDGSLNRR